MRSLLYCVRPFIRFWRGVGDTSQHNCTEVTDLSVLSPTVRPLLGFLEGDLGYITTKLYWKVK